jgi:acyl-CoA thioester hydrolase
LSEAAPLEIYRTDVQREWVDYNNHLRDGYYLVIFSAAIDAFMELIGMGEAERAATATTIYSLEAHLNFLREIKEGETVAIRAQMLGYDQKRIQLFLTMHADRLGPEPAATSEFMLVNIDKSGEPKSAPFRPEVSEALSRIWVGHETLPKPRNSGRAIALARREEGRWISHCRRNNRCWWNRFAPS